MRTKDYQTATVHLRVARVELLCSYALRLNRDTTPLRTYLRAWVRVAAIVALFDRFGNQEPQELYEQVRSSRATILTQ